MFCSVTSLSEMPVGEVERGMPTCFGEVMGGALVVMGAWEGGDRWKEFLRMPFGRLAVGLGGL